MLKIELWVMPVPQLYVPDGEIVAEVIQKNLADMVLQLKSYHTYG